MPTDDRALKLLGDMLDRAEFVRTTLSARQRSELDTDRILRSAIERELSIVGEALYQLREVDLELAESILGWKDIIRFRHVLVHGYSVLEMNIIWEIAHDDLPPLIQQLNELIAEREKEGN